MSRPPRTFAPDGDAAEAEEPDEGDAGGRPDPPRNADADEVGGGDGGEVAERSVEAELDGVVGEDGEGGADASWFAQALRDVGLEGAGVLDVFAGPADRSPAERKTIKATTAE